MKIEDRFWSKVKRGNPEDCWEWTAADNGSGYGFFYFNGRMQLAHRVSWELHFGPIPKDESYHGVCVLHGCDNRSCVNPAHLSLGSQADNLRDMNEKARHGDVSGEKHPSARLNEGIVREIKWLRSNGFTLQAIADEFGVTNQHISNIESGKRWAHI